MRVACLVGMLVLGWVCPGAAAPVLKVDEPVWTAGIVVTGKTYEKKLMVENAGDKPLILARIEECCGFFATLPEKVKLLPGEKTELLVRLAPFKMVGDLRAEIFLHSNDPVTPRFSIFALGSVVPPVHALGELVTSVIPLGRFGMRDRVAFKIRLRSVGNAPLEVTQVDKNPSIVEVGLRPTLKPGEEGDLSFEYVPRGSGPFEDRLNIVTNDALERTLEVQLQGQVMQEYVGEQAISIYPGGGTVAYDVMGKAYRFNFTVSNRGPVQIEIPAIEASLQGAQVDLPRIVAAGEAVKGSVTFANGANAAPASGWIYLQLAIPVELR